MQLPVRKTLLYKSKVEYGDYAVNHVSGCSHGCKYPCYAMLMARRFGGIRTYRGWIKPRIVRNAFELLEQEIPMYKDKIRSVHLCFTTDPFMYGFKEISEMSFKIIKRLNRENIKCTVLTKGILPYKLSKLSSENELGISLITINDSFRQRLEPFASPVKKRLEGLYKLHKAGFKTCASIEPYPTPNIIKQNINDILDALSFVDKIIFGRLNYNSKSSGYKNNKEFFNEMAAQVAAFAKKYGKKYHIKNGTVTESLPH
jgi:DNA repair photolyase